VAAWQANGYALWILERRPEAMSAFEKALALAPRREEALVYAAGLSTQLSRFSDAVDYWRRALAVNPYSVRSHFELAQLLGQGHEWQQCAAESEASLRYDPFQAPARKLLITALMQLGQKDKAAIELDKVLRMNPGEKAAIRAWFDRELGAVQK
jgi:tetratricopeptide (TPR) repeat protein